MNSLVITLPYLPPKECSPNGRYHWAERYRAGIALADDVIALVMESGWSGPTMRKARLGVTFLFPDRKRRDLDNLMASLKAGIDALTKTMPPVLIDDSADHLAFDPPLWEVRRDSRITVITVVEVG